MRSVITPRSELLPTNRAFIRHFPGMKPHVHFQLGLNNEFQITELAREWPFTIMVPKVNLEIAHCPEALLTEFALERFLPGVDLHVLAAIPRRPEALAAD